jgi:hypothetical protein
VNAGCYTGTYSRRYQRASKPTQTYFPEHHILEGRRSPFKGSIIYITDKAEFIIIEVNIMMELGPSLH